MIKHLDVAGREPSSRRYQDAFDYHKAPRAGLNWPFAQALTLSAIVWSSVAASIAFWGCLLAALVK